MTVPRYPAPFASKVFDDSNKLGLWTSISQGYAYVDINETVKSHMIAEHFLRLRVPTAEQVARQERYTGHDVVAFLSLLEDQLPQEAKRHLHWGLTSSDLVDNALMLMLSQHSAQLAGNVQGLVAHMSRWEGVSTQRPGRTHGQLADVTSWTHQMNVCAQGLVRVKHAMWYYSEKRPWKSPGPTGNSLLMGKRGEQIAPSYDAVVVPSTQVIPRDWLVEWAALYVRLAGIMENLAVLVRAGARSEVGEVAEGAARVGSSSMPHKKNPIDSEKVCGLASVARGYFTTIAEGSVLWEDRDISNSSLERIVVPDVAAVVEHMVDTMARVIKDLVVDTHRMRANARNFATRAHLQQALAQSVFGFGPVEASVFVRWVDQGGFSKGEPWEGPAFTMEQRMRWFKAIQEWRDKTFE